MKQIGIWTTAKHLSLTHSLNTSNNTANYCLMKQSGKWNTLLKFFLSIKKLITKSTSFDYAIKKKTWKFHKQASTCHCIRGEIRDKNKTSIERRTSEKKSETGSTTKMHIELQQPKIMSKNVFFITRNDAQIHFSPHLRFLLLDIIMWNFTVNKCKFYFVYERKIGLIEIILCA